MKLIDWLTLHGVSRAEFARRIGVTPAAVTQLCNNEAAWLSRETARLIIRETRGAVTPNDFLADARESEEARLRNSVLEAIESFGRGAMVVVTDDDDRENEGDLFVAASLCTPEQMAFIVRHTSGIVCAPLAQAEARRLRLDPMVTFNDAPLGTAFTVSVDVRDGLTTGISAEERTNTVRALANHNKAPDDFVRPGHVFPLIAREGGVLMRSGHTEACVDMCKLAGLPAVGVLAELVNDNGTVMRGPQVTAFAEQHNLLRISVADLIAYRRMREKLVDRVTTFPVQTDIGELTGYAYMTSMDPVQHYAFVYGDISDGREIPTRLHRCDILADVLGGARVIHAALQRFKSAGRGVLVYLRDGTAGVPTSLAGEAGGRVSSEEQRLQQWREIGLGAQILKDLGVSSIRNLASGPRTYIGISGFGIEIVSTEPVDIG